MRKRLLPRISFALLIPAAFAQSFEVASVRASAPYDPTRGQTVSIHGGPGTDDPEMYTIENYYLTSIVAEAYEMPFYRVVAPDWMLSPTGKFDIRARVPKDATNEQLHAMLRNLLLERFKMKVHIEKKEMALYELSIAKGGVKFRDAVVKKPKPGDDDSPKRSGPLPRDAEGYPILDGGTTMAAAYDHARAQYQNQPMSRLVQLLSGQLRSPVNDLTGLTGKYDFYLQWVYAQNRAGSGNGSTPLAGASDPAGPTLEQAVLAQLGLKLEKKKGPVDIVVVDSAEKTPTEN